jgi:hypothetical protein
MRRAAGRSRSAACATARARARSVSGLMKLLSGAAAIATVPLLIAAGGTRSGPVAAAPRCQSSFNADAYTRAAVTACGYKTFARTSVRALPGGGRAYGYDENGHTVDFLIPPAGFDAATATAAQLSEYGLPPRPRSAGGLAAWTREMSHASAMAPPAFLTETRAQAAITSDSDNWSGYVATGPAGTFDQAEAWYYEPTYYASSCSTNAAVVWAGVGGFSGNNDPLGQDGTAHGVPGVSNHGAWYEVYPDINITPVTLEGSNGDYMDMSTIWNNSQQYYAFYMDDSTTGHYVSLRYYTSTHDRTSAEAITERPKINGSFSNLSNFKTMTFNKSQANGSGMNNFSSLYQVNMTSGGTALAGPSAIGSSPGGHFTDSQHHCS